MKFISKILAIVFSVAVLCSCTDQQPDGIVFEVSMDHPESHTFQVTMTYPNDGDTVVHFIMPTWTPGYYQKLDFANNVRNLKASNASGDELSVRKIDPNTWAVSSSGEKVIHLSYDVFTDREFVATSYLDTNRGYIIPGALFFYPKDEIETPITIKINPYSEWKDIATGLSTKPDEANAFTAANYDVLYDSPILVGNLTSFPSFEVKGVPHYFTGYQMETIDGDSLMADLKKVIEVATDMFGDIPYKQYTFIGIGAGRGGIEHLNSTSVSFAKSSVETPEARLKTLFFLTHEYFHNYNVKRIRPIELGPFDYEKGSKTKQLWISEGLSVYYEYLIVKRAGLCTEDEILEAFRRDIISYEHETGKEFQTLAESSYDTWSDGPFGDGNNEFKKTISYYDKGPIVGLLLDFKIRTASNNQLALDDVMKALYDEYYIAQKRGFTEEEFKETCEKVTGVDIDDILEYVYTTTPMNYEKYPNAFGYKVDTVKQVVPGGWLGIKTASKNDTISVKEVEWKSPAWEAGIRKNDLILQSGLDQKEFSDWVLTDHQPGEEITFLIIHDAETSTTVRVILGQKEEAPFTITRKDSLTADQEKWIEDWLGE